MIDILIKGRWLLFLIIMLGFCTKDKRGLLPVNTSFISNHYEYNFHAHLLSSINNLDYPHPISSLACGFLGNVITNLQFAKFGITMTRALSMINSSGYNNQTFTLPFCSKVSFHLTIGYVCLFDTGNALMCLGNLLIVLLVQLQLMKKNKALKLFAKNYFHQFLFALTSFVFLIFYFILQFHYKF